MIAKIQQWISANILWLLIGLSVLLGKWIQTSPNYLSWDESSSVRAQIDACVKNVEFSLKNVSKDLGAYLPDLYSNTTVASLPVQNILESGVQLVFCKDGRLVHWIGDQCWYDTTWCVCNELGTSGFSFYNNIPYYGKRISIPLGLSGNYCVTAFQQLPPNDSKEEPIEYSIFSENSKNNIVDSKGNKVGGFTTKSNNLSTAYQNGMVVCYLILIITFYFLFHSKAKSQLGGSGIRPLISLCAGILCSFLLAHFFLKDQSLNQSSLTSQFIRTNYYNYTILEFFLLSLLFFHLSYFFHKYVELKPRVLKHWEKFVLLFFNYFLIVLSLICYCFIFKACFINSSFYFTTTKIFSIDLSYYIILACLILNLLGIFLISHKLTLSNVSLHQHIKHKLAFLLAAIIAISPIFFLIDLNIHFLVFSIASIIFVLMLDYFSDEYSANPVWLISWITLISFLTSGLIFHYQNQKKLEQKEVLISEYINYATKQNGQLQAEDEEYKTNLIQRCAKLNYQLLLQDNSQYYSSFENDPALKLQQIPIGQSKQVVRGQVSNTIYKISEQHYIIIGHRLANILEAVSMFSYLFAILLLCSYAISLIHSRFPFLPVENLHIDLRKNSLKKRIEYSVIATILSSFLIIGIVTVYYTRQNEARSVEKTVKDKLDILVNYILSTVISIEDQENLMRVILGKAQNAANVNNLPLNVYNADGNLIFSSFKSFESNKKQLLRSNAMEALRYSSHGFVSKISQNNQEFIYGAQALILDNRKVGYLETIGEYTEFQSTESHVSTLMSTLLNVYVFLFLIIGALVTLLSNSITSPLSLITDKIKNIRLGKRNELLTYSGNDEISVLVNEYNNMVRQLDDSAQALAKSERDSAWREMAQQVAHEIKNPLTPMKLSIQYLQQVTRSGEKNIEPLITTVSQTLIEQIEHLTRIASEFSNFAKLPKAQLEKIILNDVVTMIHDLYRKRDDMDIQLTVPIDDLYIYADRDHIIRILNNLVNNAIQAIPNETSGKIHISLHKQGNNALIKISDNGVGIPESMRSKVFLPNFTTKSSGTGLGLAMCQNMVEAIHGKIYFESKVNEGTDFMVELPLMKFKE